ncbi:MAG: hypothetical protein CMI96_00370 [Pelagibacteraceae bacterium]|nr:hypothetical protein [Pelagibacteraceae bacterium]|tara:strand:- start:27048 stop:27920 length:873 start_codon:yes stop_codon:yes gene_type:complete
MNNEINNILKKVFKSKNNLKRQVLQISFGIICEKIKTVNNDEFIIKYYKNYNNYYNFNAIKAEAFALIYLEKNKYTIFPKVKYFNNKILIIEYIKHNKKISNLKKSNFLDILIKLHKKKSKKFGFVFDTQIGGMKQPNDQTANWVDFFCKNRLINVYDAICKNDPMPKEINTKIESLIKNINNYIPKNVTPSLLHGDMWEGNILFNNNKVIGLIDPGIFFGHNEMELAYLRFFNFINKKFVNDYNNFIKIDTEYYLYEPVYQLYYALLNVHLWSYKYVKNTYKLLNQLKV